MDYKGYKLLDKIMLVCRDTAEHDDSRGLHDSTSYYQAYLVDPTNANQLKAARQWARWTEYGPSYKGDDGKWIREYEIKHEPVEFDFENNGFTLELLDCAGGSSQGGKLSFWNCLVSKDSKTFKIGINSDMLLDLLKNATFINGTCQSPLIFITLKGKVGMTVEGSETYKQCVADRELKKDLKKTAVTKFTFGDIVKTPTITEVYLGTITQYYKFDAGRNSEYRYYQSIYYPECTITKLAKPVTYHIFDTVHGNKTKVSYFLNDYVTTRWYSYPDFKKSCPKRTIDGKLDIDCTEEYFKTALVNKIYDYAAFENYATKSYFSPGDRVLYYFLGKETFGFGFEPFELSEELIRKIKAAGIKYIEE